MINKKLTLLLIFIICSLLNKANAQDEANMQIVTPYFLKTRNLAPTLMESTFFISGPLEQKVTGTAFLLGRVVDVDSSTYSIDSTYYKSHSNIVKFYKKGTFTNILVTAAHILKDIQGDEAYLQLRRMNSNNEYEAFPYKFKIRNDGLPLWKEPSNKADIAVMYIGLPQSARVKVLAENFLATDTVLNGLNLNAGDDLQCLGYPHNTSADIIGFPILRSGKFASYRISNSNRIPYFLFDFRVYKGNSGGPVFTGLKTSINDKGDIIHGLPFLIGLVSEQLKSDEGEVIDVAKVIPAKFIVEALKLLPPLPDK